VIKYETYDCKSILNKSQPTDTDPFIGTVNPYTGCEHGCKYCYVQSAKYLPCENIDKFHYTVRVKRNAPGLLNHLLQDNRRGIICLGSSSDPYQPAEKEFGITRKILNVIDSFGFAVHAFTKSDLILKDTDLIEGIAGRTFAAVSFSIITLDERKVKFFEPEAPTPDSRLKAMYKLAKKGITTGCSLMPVLPYITDDRDLEKVIKCVKDNGAKYVWSGELTLRDQQRERYLGIIRGKSPSLAKKYERLYGNKISPPGSYSELLTEKIEELMDNYDLEYGLNVNGKLFKPKQIEFAFS
jgi:DNA repair photolyase